MASRAENKIDRHVGLRLRSLRELNGLSQKGLAKKLGVSFQQVQKYESGANRLSASKLWVASWALKVEPSYFFEGLGTNRQMIEADDPYQARSRINLIDAFAKVDDRAVRNNIIKLTRAIGQSKPKRARKKLKRSGPKRTQR